MCIRGALVCVPQLMVWCVCVFVCLSEGNGTLLPYSLTASRLMEGKYSLSVSKARSIAAVTLPTIIIPVLALVFRDAIAINPTDTLYRNNNIAFHVQ